MTRWRWPKFEGADTPDISAVKIASHDQAMQRLVDIPGSGPSRCL
jgi:hypothetical protein